MAAPLTGLWPPLCTPFGSDGSVDEDRLVFHARRLLRDGATGLALLGTTSEANSLTFDERRRAIDAVVEAGIPADRLLPGTGACSIGEAAALSRQASELGCAAVLMLPPFYYKNVNDDGIFAFLARVIEELGAKAPRILLYHIPPQTVFGFSLDLIGRLVKAFPEVIVGLKDSSGQWDNTRAVLEAFPDLTVFPGSEHDIRRAVRHGAAGCISATGNINASGISRILAAPDAAGAEALEAEANAVRIAIEGRGLIPAVKALLATRYRDEGWVNLRPPLLPIAAKARADLMADPVVMRLMEAMPR